jgi:hypothetical protein
MNRLLVLSAALFTLAHSSFARAQAVSSADVNIVAIQAAMTPEDQFVCTAEINNQNDDDSYGTQVIVLLPLQVRITSMSVLGGDGRCTRGPVLGGYNGYAICQLGQLPQGPTVRRIVKITTTQSTAAPAYPHTCSAFIFSNVGDIQKNNNYATASEALSLLEN